MVIADSGSGTKFERIIPSPEILLTDAWLGTRKKWTAAEMISSATVRISVSFTRFLKLIFFSKITSLFYNYIEFAVSRNRHTAMILTYIVNIII